MRTYLDNAATTPICDEAKLAMVDAMDAYGNPSSTHASGRKAKAIVESVRKDIANRLACSPSEIVFTSGGTEADNWALTCAVQDLGVRHIYTSALEHHAVGHTAEGLGSSSACEIYKVPHDADGVHDLLWLDQQLEKHAKKGEKAMVSIMHANNEVGNILDLAQVVDSCKRHGALSHSDTVQTMCHYPINLTELQLDFAACAAHKFHGPKGVGFAFIRRGIHGRPLIKGGGQERGARAGTENVVGIAGLGAAFNLAIDNMDAKAAHVRSVKAYAIDQLNQAYPQVIFNGLSAEMDKSLYTVLNFYLPSLHDNSMMTFQLDIHGIEASVGSACSSGSVQGSHVILALGKKVGTRISFSGYSQTADIDALMQALKNIESNLATIKATA
ncbi:MAG: cysteine desulfurase family protein [Schleiferiaceae bacterium]|nr:cysteine desulfurase family protein [Schleiferiaceae bacterium]